MNASQSARTALLVASVLVVPCVIGCPQRPSNEQADEDALAAETVGPAIDHEPNNTADEASDLSDGGSGELGPRDVDYYRTHGSPDLWSLELSSTDPDMIRVDVVRRGQALPETIHPNHRISAGRSSPEVLVVVRPLGSERVDYAIVIEPIQTEESQTLLTEPIDRDHPALVEQFPTAMIGYYDDPLDRDAFDVLASAFQSDRPVAVEISPVSGAQPSLTVLSPEGRALSESVAVQVGQGVGIPNIGLVGSEDFIRLEVRNINGSTPTEPYTISIHAPELPAEHVELEPNDEAVTARVLPFDTTVTGAFHRSDDVDTFRVPMAQPGALAITAVPDATTDLTVRWLPAAGRAVEVDSAGIGEPETTCGLAAPEGEHYLEVAARAVDGGSLPIYTIVASSIAGNVEQEPNGMSQREFLDLETELTGFIGDAGDVDIYDYHVGIGPIDVLNVYEFSVVPPSTVDVDLELVDREGGALGMSRVPGAGSPERILVELGRGEYHVIVRGVDGASCDEQYTLRVSH